MSLTPSLARAMGLSATQRGALVGQVMPKGAAATAGLLGSTKPATVDGVQTQVGGDIITALDGQPINSFDDLVAHLARATQINQTITLTILRDGKSQDIAEKSRQGRVPNLHGSNVMRFIWPPR